MIAGILATRGAGVSSIASSIHGHATVSGTLLVKHTVTLSWTAASDQVDGYNVYRGTTSGGESSTPLNSTLIPYGTNSFLDTTPNLGPNYYIIKSSLDGVLSLMANEVFVFVGQQASITGHGSVSGLIKATGTLISAISGHASVTGTTVHTGLLVSAIHGHATVSGTPKGAASIAGSVAGQASVSGVINAFVVDSAAITGHAVVSGTARGTGFLKSAIKGQATVFAASGSFANLLASINGQASIFSVARGAGKLVGSVSGQAAVTGDLSSTVPVVEDLFANVSGQAEIGAALTNLKTASPLFSFGVSSSNPAVVNFTSSGQQNFTRPNKAPRGFWPPSALPDNASQLGWEVFPNQLMVLPSFNWLRSHPCTVTAAGYFIAPLQSAGYFNIEMAQNYFTQTGTGVSSIVTNTDLLVSDTSPQIYNYTMIGSGFVATWSIPRGQTPTSYNIGTNTSFAGIALVVNGTPYTDEITFFNASEEGGLSALASHLPDVSGAQLYSGPESNPVLLTGTFPLVALTGGADYTLTCGTSAGGSAIPRGSTGSWGITGRLSAGGNGSISCGFVITLNGQTQSGSLFSNRYLQFSKILQPVQLSMAALFSGTIFGSDSCQIGLTQWTLG